VRYWALRAAAFGIGRLPAGVARHLGDALGGLAFRLLLRERRKALESLAIAFPEKSESERRALGLECFRHLGRCAFELACLNEMPSSLDSWVEWPAADRQRLERAVAQGRGVVLATGHVGNWEVLGQCLARSKIATLSAVARPTTDPRLTLWVDGLRMEGGLRSLWRGTDGAAKSILRALRSGEMLALLIDQDTDVQSVFVPFFGRPAATPRAVADLVLRTNAPVMVAFCLRKPDGVYRVSIDEVSFEPTGEREVDVVSLTARLTARIEEAIRRAPEQWVWMHRRWKTQP
jgi:KDO2-lipid IV(A) lauroyltransferase